MGMHISTFLKGNKFMGIKEVLLHSQEPLYPEIFFSQPHNKYEYNHSLAMYSRKCNS